MSERSAERVDLVVVAPLREEAGALLGRLRGARCFDGDDGLLVLRVGRLGPVDVALAVTGDGRGRARRGA
ncbi:MAG: hypothetical protein D6701_01820, partial [Gemmatimonadetes bacterium]